MTYQILDWLLAALLTIGTAGLLVMILRARRQHRHHMVLIGANHASIPLMGNNTILMFRCPFPVGASCYDSKSVPGHWELDDLTRGVKLGPGEGGWELRLTDARTEGPLP